MLNTVEEIVEAYEDRRNRYQNLHQSMRQIYAIYEGKVSIPLADKDKAEPASVPNLLGQGIDQMAGRIASVTPMVSFSPEKQMVRASQRRAETARRAVQGWWQADRLTLKMKKRARHLIAYGMSPVVIKYNAKEQRPEWNVRSPLETFPSPETRSGSEQPADVIFSYTRSVGWLRKQGYGAQVEYVTNNPYLSNSTIMTLLEYVCEAGTYTALTGVNAQQDETNIWLPSSYQENTVARAVIIEACDMGIMCGSVPTRLALENPGGQFDSMVGMYYQQAKLMALEVAAVEKGIFPDTYLESRQGEIGRFIDGPWDGRTGKVNVVSGGVIREVANTPGYMTPQTIDRIERAQRLTAGIPQEFGGESGSNIRTGRRGDAVLSAVIDFPVAEAQDVFAFALQDENEAAIKLSKKFGGSETKTIYVGTGNENRAVKYIPDEVFSHPQHTVTYPAAGTDLNSLMIGLGQRIGMGTMSKETAATLDPFIASPELEHDRIIAEGLEQSLVAGIQQQAASGAIPPLVLSKVMTLVANDKMELADALVKVTEDAAKEAQAQQEADAAAAPPSADQMMAPAAAGALAGPEAMSAVPGSSPTQDDVAGLLGKLRMPAMTIKPMRGADQGAM